MSCMPSWELSGASNLQSQLHRIEKALGRRVCRIGLSATLGDMASAAGYLRSDTQRVQRH